MFSTNIVPSKSLNRIIFYTRRGLRRETKVLSALRQKKTTNTMRALEHFDDFYGKVFGERWPSIRCALLSRHKYCAVVNNYADTEETIASLQNVGAINFKSFFSVESERLEVRKKTHYVKIRKEMYKLDGTVEQFMLSQQEKEFEEIYPPRENTSHQQEYSAEHPAIKQPSKLREVGEIQMEPLHISKTRAKLDEQRFIDPSQRLSSAALYEYVPATKLKGMEDWVLESQHYSYYKSNEEFPVTIEEDDKLDIPTHLHVFAYERGNISRFEPPRLGITKVLNYYLMDGSSVLPVLALDLKPGDSVLDMCAAPGGKSLLMLQTLYPSHLVCNDNSRSKRIYNVLNQYLYDFKERGDQIKITKDDGRALTSNIGYNKVLVDVPCTTDRHSLIENDNSIFNPMRVKERLCLPELQTDLLVSALKAVVPGGIVVYATCSLSPIQNDGVVHMALRKVWEETNIEVQVRDLTPALEKTKPIFTYAQNIGLRYGHLVIPFLPNNFGPAYFCKLIRTK